MSRPNKGQLLLLASNTNAIQVMINGVSNNLVPFASEGSNYVLLDAPLYSVNLGYDARDSGPSNNTTYTTWPQQNIRGVLGASSSLTNFCLSYNPVTHLDVHGFTALQDLECWHCTNLLSVNITNCLALQRVCLESCDLRGTLNLSGDTNLMELRAATQVSRLLQNIHFDGGSYNALWHLCAHGNAFTNSFDFSRFPGLVHLWFWSANQRGALVLTNSPLLASVQVHDNHYTSADLHGNPALGDIEISDNPGLTNLNLRGCGTTTSQILFIANRDNLPQSLVDSIFVYCDQLESVLPRPNSAVELLGDARPSVAGWTAKNHLAVSKDWPSIWWTAPIAGTPNVANVAALLAFGTVAWSLGRTRRSSHHKR